jgi:hypothetical protein
MAVANLVPTVVRVINSTWATLQAELPKMGGEARPKAAADVFSFTIDDEGILVTIAPVSFRVKEKAAAGECAVYVTVEGTMLFSSKCAKTDLRTTGFGTRVGYFREITDRRLKHVYGIHYDHDDKLPAHPVYHSQMATMAGFVANINASHNRSFDMIAQEDDLVQGLLRNVRVPTAYMDAFSVFLQILADHLVSASSDQKVTNAFARVQSAVTSFRSDPSAARRLDAVSEERCFRSRHWYS